MSELPHPIIAKATDSFGTNPADDIFVGSIASCTDLTLLEIRMSQWRGGVWEDPVTGVNWLVVAGLAKGNHRDHDDFYVRVKRDNGTAETNRWLPTDEDTQLLKRETAARVLTAWEIDVQDQMTEILRQVHSGGTIRADLPHPVATQGALAQVTVTIANIRDNDYEADEIELEINPEPGFTGTQLFWQLTLRILISLCPPEQSWDRYKDTYSNIGEPGAWTARLAELDALTPNRELAQSTPGAVSHFTHRQHLAGRTIDGNAVRAMCGAYFVPTQDHEKLPECATCQDRVDALPS